MKTAQSFKRTAPLLILGIRSGNLMADREVLRQRLTDGRCISRTFWMSKTASALAARNIVDDIVVFSRTHASRHVVQFEEGTGLPRDVVVSARRIAAHAQSAEQLAAFAVQGQPAAKNVQAAVLLTYHRPVTLAVLSSVTA